MWYVHFCSAERRARSRLAIVVRAQIGEVIDQASATRMEQIDQLPVDAVTVVARTSTFVPVSSQGAIP